MAACSRNACRATSLLDRPLKGADEEEEEVALAWCFLRAAAFEMWTAIEGVCAAAKEALKRLETLDGKEMEKEEVVGGEVDQADFEKERWIVPDATKYDAGPGAWKDLHFQVVGPGTVSKM